MSSKKPEGFKVVLLGDDPKTSLIEPYIDAKFEERYKKSIGVEFFIKTVKLPTKEHKLILWDVNSQFEGIEKKVKLYLKDADGAIIFYDVTNLKSFQDVEHYVEKVIANAKENVKILLMGMVSEKMIRLIHEEAPTNLITKYPSIIAFNELHPGDTEKIEEAFKFLVEELIKEFK